MPAKEILRPWVPPVLLSLIWKVRRRFVDPDRLFDGHDRLFKDKIRTIQVFGEYGSGKSTQWVYANTPVTILSVDTSRAWVENLRAAFGDDSRLDVRWVDLGEVGDWGRPLSYEKRACIPEYVQSIWHRGEQPELVLVDGRFRVACFLYSLLQGRPGTPILFDDYTNRRHYHVVEDFVPLDSTCGRQGCFVVPAQFDRARAEKALHRFLYVMD